MSARALRMVRSAPSREPADLPFDLAQASIPHGHPWRRLPWAGAVIGAIGIAGGTVLLWMVVVFALVSAGQYLWLFWKRLDRRARVRAPGPVMVLPVNGKEPERKDVAAQ